MALISCPERGKEISDRVPACIHCGYPLSSVQLTGGSSKKGRTRSSHSSGR